MGSPLKLARHESRPIGPTRALRNMSNSEIAVTNVVALDRCEGCSKANDTLAHDGSLGGSPG